jgi:hypothetical protein
VGRAAQIPRLQAPTAGEKGKAGQASQAWAIHANLGPVNFWVTPGKTIKIGKGGPNGQKHSGQRLKGTGSWKEEEGGPEIEDIEAEAIAGWRPGQTAKDAQSPAAGPETNWAQGGPGVAAGHPEGKIGQNNEEEKGNHGRPEYSQGKRKRKGEKTPARTGRKRETSLNDDREREEGGTSRETPPGRMGGERGQDQASRGAHGRHRPEAQQRVRKDAGASISAVRPREGPESWKTWKIKKIGDALERYRN